MFLDQHLCWSWINITVQIYRLNPIPTLNLTIPTIVFLKSVWNYSLLRLRPHKARAFPIQSFFSSSQEMSTSTWNHKTNTKQFIIHARPACGSVILPQIYTKKGEELLDYLCALTLRVVCCHQGGDCGVSRRGPADWRTASSIRLSGSWTPSRPCPPSPFYPTQHWTLTLWPPPPPPPPMSIPPDPPPPLQPWPAPVTLCSNGMISTSSSIVCNLPLLSVWYRHLHSFCFI